MSTMNINYRGIIRGESLNGDATPRKIPLPGPSRLGMFIMFHEAPVRPRQEKALHSSEIYLI